MRYFIGVIGKDGEISEEVRRIAEETGREIAKRKAVLVCGGRGGVMEAAAKGAKENGGMTIGILPGRSRTEANPYIDVAIPTGIGRARNLIVVNCSDVVIAISGGPGTLSEVGLTLAEGKHVIAIRTSGGVAALLAGKTIGDRTVIVVESPKEAVERAFELLEKSI
ncbi:MAG: TIGR00725 family protein [Candidatus Baldrarchaeia archaeon]